MNREIVSIDRTVGRWVGRYSSNISFQMTLVDIESFVCQNVNHLFNWELAVYVYL